MNPSDLPPVPSKNGPYGLVPAGMGCGILIVILICAILVAALFERRAVKRKEASAISPGQLAATASKDGTGSDPDATLPPTWVPVYPAAQSQPGGRKQETKNAISGTYLARTRDTPAKVTDYFESTLQADGFETDITTAEANGNETAVLTASKNAEKRQVTVLANRVKGTTDLTISYQGPR